MAMITPRFSCAQSGSSVTISIYCPSVRASEVEINVDDTIVTVHINPYFLRLNFPGNLIEDDASGAQYDPSSGYLHVTLTKEVKDEDFKDLDLLAKLLAPRPNTDKGANPTIEVLASEETVSDVEENLSSQIEGLSLDAERQEILKAAANDWQLPQKLSEISLDPRIQTSCQTHYGFLDIHSGYFAHVSHSGNEVNELGADVETCPPRERRHRRIEHENEKWDEDYYMANFAEDEDIQELLAWNHPHVRPSVDFQYTEVENATMLRLPRKEYLPTDDQTHSLYHTLLGILFAYTYDARTTQHDPTPESAWTISTLTPAFSALDPPPYSNGLSNGASDGTFTGVEVSETLVRSYRRALAFPLYRSFALVNACRSDVAALLLKGKRTVVRCLLEVKHILDHHDLYYVYSKIWIDDFLVWTMAYARDELIEQLGKTVQEAEVPKAAIGWELEELEAYVQRVQNGERELDSDDE